MLQIMAWGMAAIIVLLGTIVYQIGNSAAPESSKYADRFGSLTLGVAVIAAVALIVLVNQQVDNMPDFPIY